MEKLVRILATTVPAFLAREKPISRKAKPACMKKTTRAARTTQTVSIATEGFRGVGSAVAAEATAGKASSSTPARGSARFFMTGILGPRDARVFVRVSEVLGPGCARLSTFATAVHGPSGRVVRVDNAPARTPV